MDTVPVESSFVSGSGVWGLGFRGGLGSLGSRVSGSAFRGKRLRVFVLGSDVLGFRGWTEGLGPMWFSGRGGRWLYKVEGAGMLCRD